MFSNESLVMLGNESMENQSEAFGEEMICPEISDDQSILLTDFAYWMEGVILLSIGCPGILGTLCCIFLGRYLFGLDQGNHQNFDPSLLSYLCSRFYFDINFGDRLYSKEKKPGSPLLF